MPLAVLALATLMIGLTVQHTMVMFHYPRWSPDGRSIVLSSNVDGDDEEVWVLSADGKTKRKLTDNTVNDTGADWHADGRRIVFLRHSAGGVEHFVMNADGSNVRPYQPASAHTRAGLTVSEQRTAKGQAIVLTRTGEADRVISVVAWAEQPSISPDGTLVVFEQRDREHDILTSDVAIWNLRSQQIRIISRGTDPSWSPDGRTLMFKTPRAKDNALFITTFDLATGVLRSLAPGVHPQFSPDGRAIVFMADRQDRADVHVMRVDGSEPRCLTCSWK